MMRANRTLYLAVALSLVALLVVQCTSRPQATAPSATSEPAAQPTVAEQPTAAESSRAGIFVYAHGTQFPDLDPAKSYSNDSVVMSNCYETLTFYNPPGSEEILSPKLATSWEANEDATEWVFHLRQGV
ncbi:MAG: hypothetical protein K6V36_07125 [Anaerolineae bacterium]|nr:hypothetical protein [Anaerolineae bacterium]